MEKNDKNYIFLKTGLSDVKFIVESESDEIILIVLIVFMLSTLLQLDVNTFFFDNFVSYKFNVYYH